ncbi:hypothetical protein Ahu01nite_076600 [Winogradskya humida]|uniref:ORC1/DEAH AAA+ ATPase domain-containing protein n=2 Tax=Winogradskya humida TaxID=113566 RepID=A0ABQ4A159_9ACTN|nr:hypothetical protein Ahu01nite_076600 [Actinoplanes humidus]
MTELPELALLLRDLRRRQARRRNRPELTYRQLAAETGWSLGIIAGYFGGTALAPTDRFDILVTLLDATPAERGTLATIRDRVQDSRRRGSWRLPIPRQLPGRYAPLAGRDGHLAILDDVRGDGAVLMITGMPGVGKSALATHWAHRRAARFPDGQLHLNLHGFDFPHHPADPATLLGEILDAFGADTAHRPTGVAALAGLTRSTLARRRALLVLDDAHDAEQVRPLLPGAAGCLTVITSRNPLTGLAATEGAQAVMLGPLSLQEARDLFFRRLGPRRVAAEPGAVDQIIADCGTLPLALAVMAGRAVAHPTMPLAALAGILHHTGLDALSAADTAADVRAAFQRSYQALDARAAALFNRLGNHRGPVLDAAAATRIGGFTPAGSRMVLAELARTGLLVEQAPDWYAMHELVRAYAAETRHPRGSDRVAHHEQC